MNRSASGILQSTGIDKGSWFRHDRMDKAGELVRTAAVPQRKPNDFNGIFQLLAWCFGLCGTRSVACPGALLMAATDQLVVARRHAVENPS